MNIVHSSSLRRMNIIAFLLLSLTHEQTMAHYAADIIAFILPSLAREMTLAH